MGCVWDLELPFYWSLFASSTCPVWVPVPPPPHPYRHSSHFVSLLAAFGRWKDLLLSTKPPGESLSISRSHLGAGGGTAGGDTLLKSGWANSITVPRICLHMSLFLDRAEKETSSGLFPSCCLYNVAILWCDWLPSNVIHLNLAILEISCQLPSACCQTADWNQECANLPSV